MRRIKYWDGEDWAMALFTLIFTIAIFSLMGSVINEIWFSGDRQEREVICEQRGGEFVNNKCFKEGEQI